MARSTVRPAMASMLSGLTATDGTPLFAAIYDRQPPRIDKSQWPACVIMIPEEENTREAMRLKIDTFGCQLRVVFGLPSVEWPSQPSQAGGNVYLAPDTEPQVIFDQLIDQLITGLIANQQFTQNVPGGPRSTIQLGQKITTRATEPEKRGNTITLAAIVEFAVQELITGV